MKEAMIELRLYMAEKLFSWAFSVAPKCQREGKRLRLSVIGYFNQCELSKNPPAPDDYHTHHHRNCGTKYRGCDPVNCPKDQYEKTGIWKPELLNN